MKNIKYFFLIICFIVINDVSNALGTASAGEISLKKIIPGTCKFLTISGRTVMPQTNKRIYDNIYFMYFTEGKISAAYIDPKYIVHPSKKSLKDYEAENGNACFVGGEFERTDETVVCHRGTIDSYWRIPLWIAKQKVSLVPRDPKVKGCPIGS